MIKQIQTLIDSLGNKPSVSGKDLINQLHSISQSIEDSIDSNSMIVVKGGCKLNKVDEIKRYDILYVSVLGGIPHYFMVDKVVDDKVFCVCFTSTLKDYLILHKVTGDRIFKDNFIVNTYYCLSLDEAKNSFVRVYEDKQEAIQVFNKIKKYHKEIFSF
jgi:hypothetical protein